MKVSMATGEEPEVKDVETDEFPEVQEEATETEQDPSLTPVSLDELDPNEELWPGGPTVAQIKTWKDEYGTVFITSVDVDSHYVWRKMRRSEYKQMLRIMEQLTAQGQMSNVDASTFNEEFVTMLCTLFPTITEDNMEDIDAGVPSIISQQVMDASGFVALEVREL